MTAFVLRIFVYVVLPLLLAAAHIRLDRGARTRERRLEVFLLYLLGIGVGSPLGLVAFAAAIERFLFRRATMVESILLWIATVGLLWPEDWVDAVGFVALAAAVVLQRRPGKEVEKIAA